ncbi:MAG: peptidylprolyl isomerase [Chitinophagales bacterium]|nr:peptidylprolyl isomerase [Chitinophagales bacterium]
MRNSFLLLLLACWACAATNAQTTPPKTSPTTDPVLFTYSGIPVTKSEFIQVYEKLNGQDTALYSPKSVDDYLELYTNFKLKVKEAESMGLDTTQSLTNQLAEYRKQLAQNYLYDKQITDKLVAEAYERLSKEVQVSHILIACKEDAAPADTIIAHKKALEAYHRAKAANADFGSIAKEMSEDPSAKENRGDLGFITALQTVYPFETAAYKTPKGTVSKPIRTKFGYHIVKTGEMRPARGKIQVAHIFIPSKATDTPEQQKTAEQRINGVVAELSVPNADFGEIAKRISEDRSSSANGGKLDWFGTGKMFPEFEEAAFALKNKGDVSKPLRTPIGWHIIKLLDKKPIGTFEEVKDEVRRRIEKDSRARVSKMTFINRLKKDYQLQEKPAAKVEFKQWISSDVMRNKWKAEKVGNHSAEMFSIVTTDAKRQKRFYTQNDFAKFVESAQNKIRVSDSATAVDKLYEMFVERSLVDLEEGQLDTKHPEFAKLMREFRDGNLLYELMDKKVWKRAIIDSMGLKKFFADNSSKYQWNERAEAAIITCSTQDIAKKYVAIADTANIYTLEKNLKNGKVQDAKIEVRTFERGQSPNSPTLDAMTTWKKGVSGPIAEKDGKFSVVKIIQVMPAAPKKLEEARGFVIADFQGLLEKNWLTELRAKYPVKIDQAVLKSIYRK